MPATVATVKAEFQGDTADVDKALDGLASSAKKMESAFKPLADAAGDSLTSIGRKATAASSEIDNALGRGRDSMGRFSKSTGDSASQLDKWTTVVGKWDGTKFVAASDAAGKSQKTFADATAESATKLDAFGAKATAVGSVLTSSITLPILGIGVAAFKMSNDFNAAMANVASLMPGNVARVNELKVSVQDLAIETGKSTKDLAGGLYQVLSAFGDTADTAKILEINAKAAAAGVAQTTDSINLTSAVTKAYGDTSAAAVQQVSDLALMTVRLGQTTFPELAASMGRVTPLAQALKVSQQELFGVMATGTGVTGGAAEVSTQFRGILQSLMAPTKEMTALFKQLGVANGEAMIEQLGLTRTIDTIVKAADNAGVPLQKYIGSIEGQTLAMSLAGPQAAALKEKIEAMGNAAGATDAAFAEQTQGVNKVGFAWEQFKVKLEVTAQRLGDALAPAFTKIMDAAKPLIDRLAEWVTAFGNLDSSSQMIIITIAAVAAAIGPLLLAIGSIATSVSGLMPVFAAIGTFLAGLSAPVLAVIAVVVALAAAFATNFMGIRDDVMELWADIKATFEEWRPFFEKIWEIVVQVFKTNAAVLGYIFKAAIDVIQAILKVFRGDWQGAWEEVKSAANNIWQAIVAQFKGNGKLLEMVLNLVWEGIKLAAWLAWEAIKLAIWLQWQAIIAAAKGVWDLIIAYFVGLWESVKALFTLAWEGIKALLNLKWSDIVAGAQAIWQAHITFFVNLWEGIKALFVDVWNAIAAFLLANWEMIKGAVGGAWDGIKNAVIMAVMGIHLTVNEWFTKVYNIVVEIWNNVFTYFSGLPEKLYQAALSLGKSIWDGFLKGMGIASPSGIERATDKAMTESQKIIDGAAPALGASSHKAGKSAHEGFAKGFEGLKDDVKKEIDEWLGEQVKGLKLSKELWASLAPAQKKNLEAIGKEHADFNAWLDKLMLQSALSQEKHRVVTTEIWNAMNQKLRDSFISMGGTWKEGVLVADNAWKALEASSERGKASIEKNLAAVANSIASNMAKSVAAMEGMGNLSQVQFAEVEIAYRKMAEGMRQVNQDLFIGDMASAMTHLKSTLTDIVAFWKEKGAEWGMSAAEISAVIQKNIDQMLEGKPEAVKKAAQEIKDGLIGGLEQAEQEAKPKIANIKEQYSELFADLEDIAGHGIASVITAIENGFGVMDVRTRKKINDWTEGIVQIIGGLPGKVGKKVQDIVSAVESGLSKLDSILHGLHKIFNQIPDGLQPALESVIGLFKKTQTSTADFGNQTQQQIQKTAKAAATGTGEIGSAAQSNASKFSGAFGLMGAAMAGFTTAMSVTAATGSKLTGSIVGGITGALSGMLAGMQIGAAGGPIGALGGALIGGGISLIGALFGGGKSAAQKEKEKLDLDKLKGDIAKQAQDMVTGAIESMKKALELFEKLADFVGVPQKSIAKFFSALESVLRNFASLATSFSKSGIDTGKAFAEGISPVIDVIGKAVESFEKLNKYYGVPETAIGQIIKDIQKAVDLMITAAEELEGRTLNKATKFARKAMEVVEVIGSAIEAFVKLRGYEGVAPEVFDLLYRDLKYAVDRMVTLGEEIARFMLNVAQKFAEKTETIVNTIGAAVEAFNKLKDYHGIPIQIFDIFFADLKLAVDKMIEISRDAEGPMLAAAQDFAASAGAIADTVGKAVDSFTKLKDYKGIPVEIFDMFYKDLRYAVGQMVVISSEISLSLLDQANVFAQRAGMIAEAIKKAMDAFQEIAKYTGVPVEIFERFRTDFEAVVDMLMQLNEMALNGLNQANKFEATVASMLRALRAGFANIAQTAQAIGGGATANITVESRGTTAALTQESYRGTGGGDTHIHQHFAPGSITQELNVENVEDLDAAINMLQRLRGAARAGDSGET